MRPINVRKVVGTFMSWSMKGRVVLQDEKGLRVLVDLTQTGELPAIKVLEEVLSELRRRSSLICAAPQYLRTANARRE